MDMVEDCLYNESCTANLLYHFCNLACKINQHELEYLSEKLKTAFIFALNSVPNEIVEHEKTHYTLELAKRAHCDTTKNITDVIN